MNKLSGKKRVTILNHTNDSLIGIKKRHNVSSNSIPEIILIFGIILGLILLIALIKNSIALYSNEYTFIVLCYFVMMFSYYLAIKNEGWDILSPIHIYVLFYLSIFVFTPCVSILTGNTDVMGANIMGGTYRATIAGTLSVMFFLIGYSRKKIRKCYKPIKKISTYNTYYVLVISYIFYFLGLIITLWSYFITGRTLQYIFLLGQGVTYERLLGSSDINFEFIYNMKFWMIIPWLLITHYSKNTIIKILLTYIMFALFYASGFRFIFYIMILSYAILYYRIRLRRPQIHIVLLVLMVVLIFSTILGMQRGNLRTGESIKEEKLTTNEIVNTLESNFNIYKPFYGVAEKYPYTYNYTFGKYMVGDIFVLWIPRLVWPSKPRGNEMTNAIIMKKAVNNDVIDKAAMAMPNVAPYYVDFGYIGVVLFSFLLGYAFKSVLRLFYSGNLLHIVTYGVLCGILIQYINRGVVDSLTVLIVFFLLPVIFLRKYFK